MRALLLVLLAGCATAVEDGGLPVASHALPTSTATPRIDLHLASDGALTEKGRALSLDGLSVRLARLRRPDLGPASVSDVTCVIHADRDASWGHILWILTICAEEKTALIEFVYAGGGVIPLRLPEDRCLCGTTEEPDGEVWKLWVGVDDDGTYSCVRLRSTDPGTVARWIGLKPPPEVLGVVGEIRASPFARWGAVAVVLDRFHAQGITQVELYGAPIPRAAERALRVLPPVRMGSTKIRGAGSWLVPAWRLPDGRWLLGDEPVIDEEELEELPLIEEEPFEVESAD